MTDGASTSVSGKSVSHHERVRDVDADATLGLDPWRPLHEACDRLHLQKPKSDLEMQLVGRLWNGRRDVELRPLEYAAQDFEFLRYSSQTCKDCNSNSTKIFPVTCEQRYAKAFIHALPTSGQKSVSAGCSPSVLSVV
jgi:hypothetical protein